MFHEDIEIKSYNTLKNEMIPDEDAISDLRNNESVIATNTFDGDEKLERTSYVYASMGSAYLGPHNPMMADLVTFVLKPNILKESLTQDSTLSNYFPQANTYHHSDSDNMFKNLIDSTLHSIDHIEIIATALATDVITPEKMKRCSEILIPRSISLSDMQIIFEMQKSISISEKGKIEQEFSEEIQRFLFSNQSESYTSNSSVPIL